MKIVTKTKLRFTQSVLLIAGFLYSVNSFSVDTARSIEIKPKPVADNFISNELLVKFKNPSFQTKSGKSRSRYKARSKVRFRSLGIEHWKLNKSQDLATVIQTLKADPNVAIVEPNYRRYPRSNHVQSAFPENFARLDDLRLPELWKIEQPPFRKNNRVKVAVIDDAFDLEHPDLKTNVYLPFDAQDGGADVSPEVCVYPGTSTPQYSTSDVRYFEYHGTRVMGVLGASTPSGKGITGAAENALIIPIRVSCNYSLSTTLEAFRYAIKQKADIINVSWGGPQYSQIEMDAIETLLQNNILVVTAAGNADSDNDRVPDYPSGLDLPNIISVAAVSDAKTLLEWSQFGQTSVDIAAPGNFITTTALQKKYKRSGTGTSFSAPFVAGVAASLLARSPENTSMLDIKAAIMASAVPFSDNLKARLVTDGYVDAVAAYNALNDPKPLLTISNIVIDDSGPLGNNNGQVDPGEDIILNITLSNLGKEIDGVSAVLESESLGGGIIGFESILDFPKFDIRNNQYGRYTLKMPVNFSNYYQSQNLEFSLHLTSWFNTNSRKIEITRNFSIDTGSLAIGTPITNVLRSTNDHQDELHYYHVNLTEPQGKLTIELTFNEPGYDIDFLVKRNSPPLFNYGEIDKLSGIDRGVHRGLENGRGTEQVVINDPPEGTYHIVVIANRIVKKENMNYVLSANTSPRPKSSSSSGCSLGKNNPFDPTFYLLIIFLLIAKYKNTRKTNLLNH